LLLVFAGVGVVMWRQVGGDQGMVAAGSDALVVEMADVLDGPALRGQAWNAARQRRDRPIRQLGWKATGATQEPC
jgi:hypothetical protein